MCVCVVCLCVCDTVVSKWPFLVQNSEIQLSFSRKVPLQKLVFLKFCSFNAGKINLFYLFLFTSIALINLLEQ